MAHIESLIHLHEVLKIMISIVFHNFSDNIIFLILSTFVKLN